MALPSVIWGTSRLIFMLFGSVSLIISKVLFSLRSVVSGVKATILFSVVLVFWWVGVLSLAFMVLLGVASNFFLHPIRRRAPASPVLRLISSLGWIPRWPLCAAVRQKEVCE